MHLDQQRKIAEVIGMLEAEAPEFTGATIQVALEKLKKLLPKDDAVPFDRIVASYHTCLPMLPKMRALTDARKRFVRQRWDERTEYRTIDFWFSFFERVRRSDFLTGRRENERGWLPDFEWLVRPSNFVKILEGRYDNRGESRATPDQQLDHLMARQAAR